MFDLNCPKQQKLLRELAAGNELAWAVWLESERELRAIALEVVRETTEAAIGQLNSN